MIKKYISTFVLLVFLLLVVFPVSALPETFLMKIDNLKAQLNNKLPSTVLNILLEVMKREKQLKESATLEDVEKTKAAKKILTRIKEGEFVAYVSGADGKPYMRFILKGAYVGRRIGIPSEGNPPPDQIEYLVKSIAEELIKKEANLSVGDNQVVFQDSMARGLAATRQQDFVLAIKYFKQANEANPYSAHVLFNLALAYDKTGGQELLAIAWYRAFLAIAPKAVNADQVRKKIGDLEVKIESDIRKLIKISQDASAALEEYLFIQATKTEHYQYLKRTWGKKEAEEEKKWYRDNHSQKPLEALSMAQVSAGDLQGALETCLCIKNEAIQNEIKFKIVEAQIKKGDITGARQTADGISVKSAFKSHALKMIIDFQEQAGQRREKEKTLMKYDPEIEVSTWERIIHQDLDIASIKGIKEYVQVVRDKELPLVVQYLAEAARQLAMSLEKLRYNEQDWQRKRQVVDR